MSRHLSELLGSDTRSISLMLHELERGNFDIAVDVRLLGDMATQIARLHYELGLDPHDTTSREFYRTLRTKAVISNDQLAAAIGGSHADAVSEMTPRILKTAKRLFVNPCWVIKTSVIKKILSDHPPKKTMKALGYRSVGSLVRRESMTQLIAIARYIETKRWNALLLEKYEQLTAADFETRRLEVVYLDRAALIVPLARSLKRHNLVLHSKEMGIVAIAPTAEKVIRGYTLRTMSLLLHYIGEIQAVNSLIKYHQTGKHYGAYVASILARSSSGHVSVGASQLHYRGVHASLARRDTAPAVGYMDEQDWLYYIANDMLAQIEPKLGLWRNYGHMAKNSDEVVGANIVDLSIDESNNTSYERRSLRYMRRELERELLARYLEQPSMRRIILARLGFNYE